MKYEVKTIIKKKLIADNETEFKIRDNIAFNLCNNVTNNHDHYIGRIVDITDIAITIAEIELNGKLLDEDTHMVILLDDIEDNSCTYVYD